MTSRFPLGICRTVLLFLATLQTSLEPLSTLLSAASSQQVLGWRRGKGRVISLCLRLVARRKSEWREMEVRLECILVLSR